MACRPNPVSFNAALHCFNEFALQAILSVLSTLIKLLTIGKAFLGMKKLLLEIEKEFDEIRKCNNSNSQESSVGD